jgi:hypothetical protein
MTFSMNGKTNFRTAGMRSVPHAPTRRKSTVASLIPCHSCGLVPAISWGAWVCLLRRISLSVSWTRIRVASFFAGIPSRRMGIEPRQGETLFYMFASLSPATAKGLPVKIKGIFYFLVKRGGSPSYRGSRDSSIFSESHV